MMKKIKWNKWKWDHNNPQSENTGETIWRGTFIALQVYLKKQEKTQINNLTLHLKNLKKNKQNQNQGKEGNIVIKIKAEINEIESKKMIQKINESKSWFFKKINKIGKALTRLIKKKREMTKINKIRNERGDITTNTKKRQMIVNKML